MNDPNLHIYCTYIVGKTKLGNVCTRTTIWNNECEADLTCTTRVCGASRCWPEDHPRPHTSSRFCSTCWFLPWACHMYFDWVPQQLDNLPTGYICSDLVNSWECAEGLKCTAAVCGASRCWPEGKDTPPAGSGECATCWFSEINCPSQLAKYTK